ncbi:hypothetical protein W03_16830 [Nitrosomonas sp. PY1]|uniref:hypothetical protein n=1 Tax=Nitrosomonas sp. PY1 TaxID=1803906 RepID=UPI001FC80D29|nr:hypothetical protein [Nitrosomonas sp. PY1]GKS69679.1 hypothetical protein W03_16830 [Nitrosomonas sp. PY1]
MLKLAFPGGFQYHRNTGLRTAETPLPFKVLGRLESKQIEVAETECESSNRILEVLEEWNDYLKHNVPYYQEPLP